MTRLLHVSDTHLGYRQYHSDERREDFFEAFEQVIDHAEAYDVDAVIHTGDLFHDRTPSLQTQMRTAQQLRRLNRPFYGIVGNHERKRETQFMDLLSLAVDNVHRIEDPVSVDGMEIHGVDSISNGDWNSIDLDIREDSILCLHELVSPLVPEHFDPIDAYDILDELDQYPEMVLLGDYHERIEENVAGSIWTYPGSTEKTSRSEPDDKYVSLIDIEDEIDIHDIPIETRDFQEVVVELESGIGDVRQEIDGVDFQNSVLHVVLRGDDVNLSRQQIHLLGEGAGASIVRVDDQREFDDEDIEIDSWDVDDIESSISEHIEDSDLSETAQDVDQIVRDDEVKKTHVRDESRERIDEELNA